MTNQEVNQKLSLIDILYEVQDERERQDEKWGIQNHNPIEWISILSEEVGEASKEALEYHFKNIGNNDAPSEWNAEKLANYRKELIQVAAVAVSMVQSLDRDEWGKLSRVCRGKCGLNYCDENGCSDRKRELVNSIEIIPS